MWRITVTKVISDLNLWYLYVLLNHIKWCVYLYTTFIWIKNPLNQKSNHNLFCQCSNFKWSTQHSPTWASAEERFTTTTTGWSDSRTMLHLRQQQQRKPLQGLFTGCMVTSVKFWSPSTSVTSEANATKMETIWSQRTGSNEKFRPSGANPIKRVLS